MKTIVLNLKDATERRKYMTEVLSTQNIDFEFFDSLSPNDIDPNVLEKNSSKLFSQEGVATFETHRKAIGHAKVQNDFILVLEDDATPTCNNVFTEINRLVQKTKDFDIMFLGYVPKGFRNNTQIICEDFKKIKKFFGFHSYIINPKSVDKILNLLGNPNCHIDGFISELIRENKINALFTINKLFKQNITKFKTQIPKKKDMI